MSSRVFSALALTFVLSACPRPGQDTTTSTSSGGGCTQGGAGCACRSDMTCDAPLVCNSTNTCVAPSGGGRPGEACDATRPCGSFEGSMLTCTSGLCELAGCPTATVACPCGPSDTCNSGLTCSSAKICEQAGCTPGSANCTCRAGGMCDDGLQCITGACRAGSGGQLEITAGSADVRACDVLLEEGTRQITAITFPDGTKGQMVRRGKKVAVSVISTTDANPSALARITLSGTSAGTPSDVTIVSSACHNRTGSPITAPAVSIR